MPLAAGQALSHYEILGSIGAGAMGEVYRARDTRLDREVAIKVLPEELAGDGERLRRFDREARMLAALNHPNVAQVYGIDEVDGTCFMAMELVPGQDLASRLARGPMRLEEAIDVCRQVAEGVEAAHEAGVIHRDLKPANVLVAPDGRVKVLDFGLAKPAQAGSAGRSDGARSTEEGRLLGTPTYMAPEQARGKPIDRRVDVWAFGCVLFECLTGRRAFDGETVSDVLAALLEKEPDLSRLPSGVPARVRDLIERCLRKDPRRRLRDIGDARLELEELVGEGTAVPPALRSRWRVAVPVVLALGAGTWLVAGWIGSRSGQPSAYDSKPLTFSQYFDRDPTWSPGGERIAFSRLVAGSIDLWIKNIPSEEEFPLRTGPGDEICPRWSPDGRYIAVVSTDLPGTPVVLVEPRSRGAGGERVLVDTNGRVFDVVSLWRVMGARPWSQDGSSLLLARATGGNHFSLFRKGVDDGTLERLTSPPVGSSDGYGSYSFDGERIVFVRFTHGKGALMQMPASGGDPEMLLDTERLIGLASFGPDGSSIYFIDQVGLWELDLASRSASRLIFTPDQSSHHGEMSIGADGRIAYAVGRHDTTLTRLMIESGERTQLTSHFGSNFFLACSSRDEIAYSSDRTGDAEIWVRAPSGRERRVTHDAGIDTAPDWSPDGERMVFRSDRDGAFKAYLVNRDGGDCRLLSDLALSDGLRSEPRWSPSSPAGELIGCIVSEEGGNALFGVRPDRREELRLFEGVVDFDWYEDSRRIVCTLDEGRAEKLVAVHLETGEVQELWEGPHDELEVSPDGRFVMFAAGLGHASMGRAILPLAPPDDPDGLPVASGEPVDLVRPDGPWHTHHGTWAPDMKSIVYVHDADRANIYELIGPR